MTCIIIVNLPFKMHNNLDISIVFPPTYSFEKSKLRSMDLSDKFGNHVSVARTFGQSILSRSSYFGQFNSSEKQTFDVLYHSVRNLFDISTFR